MNRQDTPPNGIAAAQDAFLALVDPHYDAFERYVRAMTRDVEDARDVVHETLLIAWTQRATLRKPESILSYLITIARRVFWSSLRRRRWFTPLTETHERLRHDAATAPDVLADLGHLYEALDRLPARMREAVVLFEITGLSLEEIRVVQGGTLSGVKARVARGRRKLAALLGVAPGAERQAHITHSHLERVSELGYEEAEA